MPENITTYKTDKGVFEIPDDKKDAFIKSFPGAIEVQSFISDKDTFDIPIDRVDSFIKSMPSAKPLKKKDESQSEDADGVSASDGNKKVEEPPTGFRTVAAMPTQEQEAKGDEFKADNFTFDQEKTSELSERIKKEQEDKIALYRKPLSDARESIQKQYDELEAKYPQKISYSPFPGESAAPYNQELENKKREYSIIRQSEKYINEIESILDANSKGGAISSLKLKTKNLEDLLSVGWQGVFDAKRLKSIAEKASNNENITDEELTLLSMYGFTEDVKRDVYTPISYDVVGGLIDMIPYMANIAATGGVGTSVSKTTSAVIKENSKKAALKYASRGANYLLGKSVQSLAFPMLYEGAAERQVGNISYGEDGKLYVSEGDKPIPAFLKSYGSTLAEIGVEGFMDDVVRYGKATKNNGAISNFIRNEAKFGGFIEENLEEFATAAIQAPIEGQTLQETFTPRMIATTLLTVGAMSGSVNAIDYATNKNKGDDAAKSFNDEKIIGDKLSSDTKKKVDKIIDGDQNINKKAADIEQVVDEGRKDKGWSNEDVMTVGNYAVLRQRNNTFNSESVRYDIEGTESQQTEPIKKQEEAKDEKEMQTQGKENIPQEKQINEKQEVLEEKSVQPKDVSVEAETKLSKVAASATKQDVVPIKGEVEDAEKITPLRKESTKEGQEQEEQLRDMPSKPKKVKEEKVEKRDITFKSKTGEGQIAGEIISETDEKYRVKGDNGTVYSVKKSDSTLSTKKDDVSKARRDISEANKKYADVENAIDSEASAPKQSGFVFMGDIGKLINPKKKPGQPKSIKSIANRYLSPKKGLPSKAFTEVQHSDAAIRERQIEIKESVSDAINNIYKAYGSKLTEADKENIQSALESMGTTKESIESAYNKYASIIPEDALGSIRDMRSLIDSYSNELSKLDMIGVDLKETIDKNRGYYLTRTYKKYTDREWTWDKIPAKIKKDAASVIMDLNPEMTSDEVIGTLRSMLEDANMTSSIISKGNSVADIDKKSLKKRSQFLTDHPEVRAFLGENRDPFYNYAVSLTRMAEMIERGRMVKNIIDWGVSDGWLSEKPSNEKNLISQPTNKEGSYSGINGYKKISEYYTTPDIKEAIDTFFGNQQKAGNLMALYLKVVSATKIAKTAGSLKGLIRNFKSNMTNALANGNWNIVETSAEITNRLKDKGDFIRELTRNGIIGDNISTGELIRNIQDISDKLSYVSSYDESFASNAKRKIVDTALKLYGAADDVWKAYRYVSEYKRYYDTLKKSLPDNEALDAAKSMATNILHRTSTYYSQLPLLIQNFRKVPFANTFISFPYLTLTNYIGTLDTAIKEIKSKNFKHIGLQRMAGSFAGVSTLALTAMLRNRANGQDEDDVNAYRRFLPDFWKNDIITIVSVDDSGVAEYSNTSYMDYYNVVTTPVMMLSRRIAVNGELTDKDLVDAASEFFGSFIAYDIVFDRTTNLISNKDRSTGFPIYNPEEDLVNKWNDISRYMLETVEPGISTDARRIYKTWREGGEWERQLKGVFLGNQNRTIDPIKSMDSYKLWDYRDGIYKSQDIYTDELRKYNRLKDPNDSDKKILDDARKRSEKAINGIVEEMRLDLEAMRQVGVPGARRKLSEMMKSKSLPTAVRESVFSNKNIYLDREGKFN